MFYDYEKIKVGTEVVLFDRPGKYKVCEICEEPAIQKPEFKMIRVDELHGEFSITNVQMYSNGGKPIKI
jgi:hypothetical protein